MPKCLCNEEGGNEGDAEELEFDEYDGLSVGDGLRPGLIRLIGGETNGSEVVVEGMELEGDSEE